MRRGMAAFSACRAIPNRTEPNSSERYIPNQNPTGLLFERLPRTRGSGMTTASERGAWIATFRRRSIRRSLAPQTDTDRYITERDGSKAKIGLDCIGFDSIRSTTNLILDRKFRCSREENYRKLRLGCAFERYQHRMTVLFFTMDSSF